MTTQVAYMHIAVLIILVIAGFASFIGFLVAYCNDSNRPTWALSASLFSLVVGGFCTAWWIKASNEPYQTGINTTYEIKEVIYPDGTKVQMCAIDGGYYNVTQAFEKWLDEKQWQIRHVTYLPVYCGVSYSGTAAFDAKGKFFLEKKDSTQSYQINIGGTGK